MATVIKRSSYRQTLTTNDIDTTSKELATQIIEHLSSVTEIFNHWLAEIEKMAIEARIDDLSKAVYIIEWTNEYLTAGTDAYKKNHPGYEGGLNPSQLDYLNKKYHFYDMVDRKVTFQKESLNPEDTTSNPFFSKWRYEYQMGKRKKRDNHEGLEFKSLVEALTDAELLEMIYKSNGVFIASDEPELSILFSDALIKVIEWTRKDNKNAYVSKAVEARKAKIFAFYETLRPIFEDIKASNDKITSYRLAAEFNKMNIETYTKSGNWMPNMVDSLKKYLSENQPIVN